MTRLVRAELIKLRTTQVWFWLLVAAVLVSGLLVVAQIAPSDGVRTARDVPDVFSSSSTASIVVFVLGVLGVTTEFRYQTITPTVLQTPSRWAVVTAKMITYAVVGLAYAVVCVLVQLAIAVPWLSSYDVSVDLGNGNVRHALLAVLAVVALYGILGLGAGALIRNQIVAVTVGVIFLLVVNNLLLVIPGVKHVWPYTPEGASRAILHTTGDSRFNGVSLLSTGGGIAVLLVWAFVLAILGAAFSMTRDIT